MALTERELLIVDVTRALIAGESATPTPVLARAAPAPVVPRAAAKVQAKAKAASFPKVTGKPPRAPRETLPAPAPTQAPTLVNELNVLEVIAQHDDGATIGQIAGALQSSTDVIRPVLFQLAIAERLTVTGQKRGTRYHVVKGAPARLVNGSPLAVEEPDPLLDAPAGG